MAACWSALHARREIDLHVVARGAKDGKQVFDPEVMGQVPHTIVTAKEAESDLDKIAELVRQLRPDVLVVPGWVHGAYNALPFAAGLSHVPVAMTMDTPFENSWRQRLGRYRHPKLFARIGRIVVPGERGAILAKVLGFAPERIVKGMYGVDVARFSRAHEDRLRRADGWPKQFLYMGRYEPEKAIDVMVDGYRAYRDTVKDPWPLVCMGQGELGKLLKGVPGIVDKGFVQPRDQPSILVDSAVCVLASTFDPWPLVVVESGAAGLPIVCTETCGSAVELVRPFFNGRLIPSGDCAALAEAMRWMHEHHDQLPEMGRRGRELASAYTAQMWAERWVHMLRAMAAERHAASPA